MSTGTKTWLLGALLGTFVMFFWGATEWINPLLHQPYLEVNNPSTLNQTLQEQLPESGIYIWPNGPATKTEAGAAKDLVYFIAKQDASFYRPGKFMLVELFTQLLTWLLITYLLLQLKANSHKARLQLVALSAILVGLGYFLPMWNWWGFSTSYTLIRWGNLLVGWLLAGAAVSWWLQRRANLEVAVAE